MFGNIGRLAERDADLVPRELYPVVVDEDHTARESAEPTLDGPYAHLAEEHDPDPDPRGAERALRRFKRDIKQARVERPAGSIAIDPAQA